MELAERLGMTVGELTVRMSSTEYTAWIALSNLRHKEYERAEAQRLARKGRF